MRKWLIIDANNILKSVCTLTDQDGKELSYYKAIKYFLNIAFSAFNKTKSTDIILLWSHEPYSKLDSLISSIKQPDDLLAVGGEYVQFCSSPACNKKFYKIKNELQRTFKDTRLRSLKCKNYENIDILYWLIDVINTRKEQVSVCSNDPRFEYVLKSSIPLYNVNVKNNLHYTIKQKTESELFTKFDLTGVLCNFYEVAILANLYNGWESNFKPLKEFRQDISLYDFMKKVTNPVGVEPIIRAFINIFNAYNILEQDNSCLCDCLNDFLNQRQFQDNKAYGFLMNLNKVLGSYYFKLVPTQLLSSEV